MFIFSNLLTAVALALKAILNLYFWVVIAATIVSWFRLSSWHPVVRFLRAVTEPVFYRVRRLLPFVVYRGIDFSPLLVLVAIQFVEIALVGSLVDLAAWLR